MWSWNRADTFCAQTSCRQIEKRRLPMLRGRFMLKSIPVETVADYRLSWKRLRKGGPTQCGRSNNGLLRNGCLSTPINIQFIISFHNPSRHRSKLAGQSSFIAEICANGLLEWALDPLSGADMSRVDQLKETSLQWKSRRQMGYLLQPD